MLSALLKKQFTEIFHSYFYDAKKKKARTRAGTICYLLFFVFVMTVVLGGVFTLLSFSLCGSLVEAKMDWLYFCLMGLLSILLGAFGSVFSTYSGLYLAKDNDLLLSMPIPVRLIMLCRLLSVYLMGLMYVAVVLIPATVVYFIIAPFRFEAIVGAVFFLLFISLFVLTLSCLLGWVVAKLSQKLKNRSLVAVFGAVVLILLYYFVYFKAQSLITELLTHAAEWGERIKGAAYPLYLFGRVGVGDVLAILAVGGVTILLLTLVCFVIARSFLSMATGAATSSRAKHRERNHTCHGQDVALLSKEWRRFLSSPNYMLNCGLGILLLPAASILLLIQGNSIFPIMEELFSAYPGSVIALLGSLLCLIASMNSLAAPSVSLEGVTLWQCKVLPIAPYQVLRAKLSLALLVNGIPLCIALICLAPVVPGHIWQLAAAALLPISFVCLHAITSLCLGLKMPNLSWTNELTPIKQSMPVFLSICGGWLFAMLPFGLYMLFGYRIGITAFSLLMAAFSFTLFGLLYHWLKKRGGAILAAL